MRNIRLTIAYDGTNYHGFQRQPEFHGPTIQGTLEKVWQEVLGEEIRIFTAGRTDTGVHAAGQVVSFFSETRIPEEKIPKAFNSLLPRDIRILEARNEHEDFNARRSAKWKRYDYLIDNRPIPDVFRRLYACHEPIALNVKHMQEAAKHLEGKHNFKAFASAGGASKTFERTLFLGRVELEDEPFKSRVTRVGEIGSEQELEDVRLSEGNVRGMIRITCIGDGFLYNMVRIIAGTLLEVGKGKIDPSDIPVIIESQDRKQSGETAPPHGLTLTYVNYDAKKPQEIFPELY
ncbi:tRNA pseudouridine(38-40) synthase TruA [Paradesulfitobacterium aromaticivorans]